MNRSGLWLQGLSNLLAKFLGTQGSPDGGGLPVAEQAKGAILTLAIIDALEVGPGAPGAGTADVPPASVSGMGHLHRSRGRGFSILSCRGCWICGPAQGPTSVRDPIH